MNTVANIPFDMFVNMLAQIWNTGGIPILLGTVAAGLTQHVKLSPTLLPMVSKENVWITRGFVVLCCVVLQVIFDLISHQPISVSMIHDLIINYFAASVSYTHIFKAIDFPPVSTEK